MSTGPPVGARAIVVSSMWEKLEELERRFEELAQEMARPEVAADYERLQALAKEHAALERTVSLYRQYKRLRQAAQDAAAIIEDGSDPELVTLAREELSRAQAQMERLERELRLALLPKSPLDEKDVIVEIRAAAGGEEAALFAADLFRMYSRYAERQGWEVEVISSNPSDLGGFKEVIFEVRGKGAYSRLKYESGVHRVQRVPVTEAGGRIHTSTATVAVLPEPDEVDLHVDEKDLRIEVFGASGHGGQHIQKNATAVRVIHIPTGLVVVCQDERSQHRNRQRALQILRARLLDMEQRKQQEEIEATRRSQVGSGERAEKIRTYNFPQDRVTDHRIGLTLYNLQAVLDGELDPIIDALLEHEQARLLEGRPA